MASDFQLRFQSGLHQQVDQLVRDRVGPLEQDISRFQREVNQAFTALLEKVDAAAILPESSETIHRIAADVSAEIGRAEAESARLTSSLALLKDALEELGKQTSQAEVLNTLVDRLAGFAPRLVLFVVKGANALGWAARGLDDELGKVAVRSISIPVQTDTVLKAALESGQTQYVDSGEHAEDSAIFARFGPVVPARVLSVPLKVRGKAAAILYADCGDRGPDSINVEAIELLVGTTGLVVELTSLRSRIGENASRPQPAVDSAAVMQRPSGPLATPSGGLSPAASPAAPPSNSGEPRTPAPSFFAPAATTTAAEARTGPTGAVSAPPNSAGAPARAAEPALSGPLKAPMDEDERLHNDARRFARLLVSEIKLYNEQKVVEGRSNRDLYDRLKEDIDRSRQMYDKRVAPVVATKFDYFYDELVNTLAEGDPTKLGSDYPGPSVRV